jgi:putative SOS response-associated peptidase YedK
MCNDFANRISWKRYQQALEAAGLLLARPGPEAAPNLEPRDDIRPTDPAPVLRLVGDTVDEGLELLELRWGFRPPRPKASPVINFRAEGRRFGRQSRFRRCLVPVSGFYEFTGARHPKTKWRFDMPGLDWFCLAGLYAGDPDGDRFTLLTVNAGADVAPIHDRQPIPLAPDAWAAWLDPDGATERLLVPSPPGALAVEKVAAGRDETDARLL